MVPDVEKIVISITTEEAIMNNKFWNEFYQSGKISDYLNYVNSSEHTARSQSTFGGSRCGSNYRSGVPIGARV